MTDYISREAAIETIVEKPDMTSDEKAGIIARLLAVPAVDVFQEMRESIMVPTFIKLEIFIPESHLSTLQVALQSVDAGHIGSYDSCLSYSPVTGTWRPLEGTSPYNGEIGKVCEAEELKVEVTIKAENLQETVAAIKAVHPYEEPVINAIPLIGVGL